MNAPTADRNLLFGILALQMDFIDREQLAQVMNAWVLEKSKGLGQLLHDRGDLTDQQRDLLETLVDEHLKKHDNDLEKSIAAVGNIGAVRDALRQIGDAVLLRIDKRAVFLGLNLFELVESAQRELRESSGDCQVPFDSFVDASQIIIFIDTFNLIWGTVFSATIFTVYTGLHYLYVNRAVIAAFVDNSSDDA